MGKILIVEFESVLGDIGSIIFIVEFENILLFKRKLIKKEVYEIEIEDVDYKIMYEFCNFVGVEFVEDVFYVRKRLKKKDVEEFEKLDLVLVDEMKFIFCEKFREDNDNGVRSYFICINCNMIDVDVSNLILWFVIEFKEVIDYLFEFNGLDDRNFVFLQVVCMFNFVN